MADDRETWLEQLNGVRLPALAETKHRLDQALGHPATSHTELGQIVAADPALSLRLFRALADSGRAPREAAVTNPTRVIGLLGQSALIALASSTPTLEERYRDPALAGLKACYGRALHAALFARLLATLGGRSQAEDDATAALLQGLGEMLMWARWPGTMQHIGKAARRLEDLDLLALGQIGVCPSDLGETLTTRWGLPASVARAQRPHNSFDPDSQLVLLAANLAWSGLRQWSSDDTDELVELAAELTRMDVELVRTHLHREVASASRAAHALGLPFADHSLLLLPVTAAETGSEPVQTRHPPAVASATVAAELDAEVAPGPRTGTPPVETRPRPQPPPPGARPPAPSPVAPTANTERASPARRPATRDQRDAQAPPGRPPPSRPNPLQQQLSVLLRRIRKEQGLERILLALMSSDRSEIRARLALERQQSGLTGFCVPVRTRNLFSLLLSRPHALWVNPSNRVRYQPYIPAQVAGLINSQDFFAVSLVVRGRSIGLLYADAAPRTLDERGFARFKRASQEVAALFAGSR
jgi:HD-like signal output (HDOD) protein